jgi:hypothetical protein
MCAQFFGNNPWNQEPTHVVGASVPTDLCSALVPSEGNTVMQSVWQSIWHSIRQSIRLLVVSVVAAVAIVSTFASTSAVAQDKKGDKGGTPKVKVYDFSGDTIEGDLIRPEGTTVDARDFAKHSSLIRIRKDFIPEIIKSAEDL